MQCLTCLAYTELTHFKGIKTNKWKSFMKRDFIIYQIKVKLINIHSGWR